MSLIRRGSVALLGAIGLVGCTALTSLNDLTRVSDDSDAGGVDASSFDAQGEAAIVDASMDSSADADATVADASVVFIDDFNRANGPLGNGWIEKTPASFAILGGVAQRQADTTVNYTDAICYRPASEDVLDVEASVEVYESQTNSSPHYPQIYVRVQSNSISTPGMADGYGLYINDDPAVAILGRQGGSAFVVSLATLNLAPAIDQSARFRLRLSATGTTSVQLEAYVETLTDGGAWQVLGHASYADTSPMRIAAPGSVGFSGGSPEALGEYVYDNFTRTSL